jgi:hypothetical protein
MRYLIAWIALPLVVVGASWGVGLLVERLSGLRFPNGIAVTIGFVTSFVALAVPYQLGLGAPWGGALLVVLAVTGIVLARGRLADSVPDPLTLLAALAVYGLYMAPIVLSGHTTFAGYTLLGDTSVHFSLIDYISDHGARLVSQEPSSFSSVTDGQIRIGYPLGLHYELGSVRWLLGAELSRLYQPFLATTIALAVPPVVQILRNLGIGRTLAALGALIVLAAYLPYSYALQGGIKELGMITVVLLGGWLAWELASGERPVRVAVIYGIVTAAAFEIYSWGGLPWPGLMGLAAVGLLLWRLRDVRAVVTIGAIAVVAFAVAALPQIPDSLDFYTQGNRLLGSSSGADVGNLIGPIRIWEAFGVWLVDDFRLPPNNPEWTYALVGVVGVLALFGTIWSLQRRGTPPLIIAAAAFLVWLIIPAGLYIEAKFLTILSPAIVLLAVVGGWALVSSGRIPEAAVLVLAATLGIFISDALGYHGTYLAPTKRMDELSTINDRFSGRGPAMLDEFEEYGKHYLRDIPPVVPFDAWTPAAPSLRFPGLPVYARYYDIDVMTLPYVEQFPLLIQRRSPVASRPPSNYRSAFVGRYYEVWQRTDRPRVAGHVSLGDGEDAGATVRCGQVTRLARTAPAGSRLVAAERPRLFAFPVRRMRPFPRGWSITQDKRVAPVGAGRTGSDFTSPGGRFTVWFRGSFGRGATVLIDGKEIGRARDVQTPQQGSDVGAVTLTAGRHRVEIVRGGGNLKPGNGQDEVYDTVFVAPDVPVRLRTVPLSQAHSLCGRHLDWIEVTASGAGGGARASLPEGQPPCPNFNAQPLEEPVLLKPRRGTFYSVDALNPDVVQRGNRYYMFFSGNSARSDIGRWRTGLATSNAPEGPFQVDPRVAAPQLNGGTIAQGKDFVQGYDRRGERVPVFGRSADGRAWRMFTTLPAGRPGDWNYFPSDLGMQGIPGGFRAYFAGRWTAPRHLLTRMEGAWDGRDLGEPSVFEVNGREYMLYGGLTADAQPRSIGIAVKTGGGWRRCGDRPLIPAGGPWYASNAIDPEPLVAGDRLYVYFAGGDKPSLGGNMAGTIGVRVYRLSDLFG